jgi:hypothetical protein
LAREIIKRVDSSPYGSKTHKRGGSGGAIKSRSSHNHAESEPGIHPKIEGDSLDLHSTHPSHEWQDHVTAMLEGHNERDPHTLPSDQGPSQYTSQHRLSYTGVQQPLMVSDTLHSSRLSARD